MGYTHYYRVKKQFDKVQFHHVTIDFKKMVPVLSHLNIKLAGPNGEGTPTISPSEIAFNGVENCGHLERQLGITWPAKNAKGVSSNKVGTQIQELVKGSWFAGASLETRVCGGDCSHESFFLVQKMEKIPDYSKPDEKGFIFEFTKTAYKPYDLAVNVALIIAKHYLKDDIKVSSDGEANNWIEGMQLCQKFLGYGEVFKLDE